jgi:hypothetical protein
MLMVLFIVIWIFLIQHLAKIETGNTTLDNALPDFNERVDESIGG